MKGKYSKESVSLGPLQKVGAESKEKERRGVIRNKAERETKRGRVFR